MLGSAGHAKRLLVSASHNVMHMHCFSSGVRRRGCMCAPKALSPCLMCIELYAGQCGKACNTQTDRLLKDVTQAARGRSKWCITFPASATVREVHMPQSCPFYV